MICVNNGLYPSKGPRTESPNLPKAVPPYVCLPVRVPRKVPIRPSLHVPTATSVPSVWARIRLLHPVPITVYKSSTPWMPYQKKSGCVFSMVHGLYASAPSTLPILPFTSCCALSIYLSEEEENTGTL